MEPALFCFFGSIALAAAVSVILQRRVFYSALSLIVCLCSLSALYLLLQAPFIAAVQVIVYAGAIMVLFLFVIMMLDPFAAVILTDKMKWLGPLSIGLGAAILLLLLSFLSSYPGGSASRPGQVVGTEKIGRAIFNEYLLPFEVTSILILVGIIGAVVLGRKRA